MTEIKHSVASRSAAVVHVIIGNDDAYSRNNKIAQCHQMRSSKTNIPNPSMPVEGFEPSTRNPRNILCQITARVSITMIVVYEEEEVSIK